MTKGASWIWPALSIFGPMIALTVTWESSLRIANIDGGEKPDAAVIERLRAVPDDATLTAIEKIAVGAGGLGGYSDAEIIAAADQALAGRISIDGAPYDASVPNEGPALTFGRNIENLTFCRFVVPHLLTRAYDVSGDIRYLLEAVKYVLAWSKFEASLVIPRGLVFNDHAMAARAIVVTNVWRRYRRSAIFDADQAAELLRYAQKLSRLLLYEPLYEYRSNHGIMQSLALLHLGIAYPLLERSKEDLETGKRRLLQQLRYYVNEEGVVLENSPAYHENGLFRLAAAWRYLGILGEPVPDEFAARYRKALAFRSALMRPDRTLPPIGDTDERPFAPLKIATFDATGTARVPLRDEAKKLPPPEPAIFFPAAGWIVLWDGLAHWPESNGLTQTVLHWGNFPTEAHKHADELALSLWSGGVQWLRGVGYWPYDRSRPEAVGWRSSNAPHWLHEPALSERQSSMVGHVSDRQLTFVDLLRTNADGRRIRRQFAKIGDDTRVVLDSFASAAPGTAETIWRFPPGVAVHGSESEDYSIVSPATDRELNLQFGSTGPFDVRVDTTGTAAWNSGMVVDGEVTASPAIQVISSANDPALFAIVRLTNGDTGPGPVTWRWDGAVNWQLSLGMAQGGTIGIARSGDTIQVRTGETGHREYALSATAATGMDDALAAWNRAAATYGIPWQPVLDRRVKVTAAIVIATIAQFAVFALFAIGKATGKRWWPPLTAVSLVAWLGLSLFLGMRFLV